MKTVIVAGDLIWDNNLVQKANLPSYHYETTMDTARLYKREGGAWYLKDMVSLACTGIPGVEVQVVLTLDEPFSETSVNHAYQIWSLFPKDNTSKIKTWRIDRFLGRQGALSPPTFDSALGRPLRADLIVLDNQCLGYFKKD